MKIVQNVGSDAPTQNEYTGPEREITVDTDNWDLRLHDGSTPGGRLLINRDNGDERWQLKSDDLDGIDFTAEKRGFLTRLGTGLWRIRQWEFNEDQFLITNRDGYGGNPSIELLATIGTAHTFTQDITIQGTLTASGGVVGNLTGNVTGNIVGNVVGNVTGNLTGNVTGDVTGNLTGGFDTRGSAIIMDDASIDPDWINGLSDYVFARAIPVGMIMMWGGDEDDIPTGFALCDGQNGTPDLSDRFIVAGGTVTYPAHVTGGVLGGAHTHTMQVSATHTHTFTTDNHQLTVAEMPEHYHTSGVTDNHTDRVFNLGYAAASPPTDYAIEGNTADGIYSGLTSADGGDDGHSHTGTTAAGGSHTHTIDNADTLALPPYYALCYIMRVA